jgi:uncharacterized RmlC-like cupin family protein
MTAPTGTRTCAVVNAHDAFEGKQGFSYMHGISAESVGSVGICMHMLNMPPGARAKAHMHAAHETTIYVLSGRGGMWYGEQLEQHLLCEPGTMIYIPAGMPHLPYNMSQTEPCTAVLARTDPNEQESVVLRPDLEHLVS